MADEERGKRRRGRRGGRGEVHRRPIEERGSGASPVENEATPAPAADAGSSTGRRFLRFRRGGDTESAPQPRERNRGPERSTSGAAPSTGVSPMDFWRSGAARTYKPAPERVATGPWWMRRISNFYLPPWAPVVGIIVVVFGILGFLFIVRSATGAPRIGDHWHAPYQFFACGEKQPNAVTWESGVHTHGDGIMHIHPFQTFEEGSGARMVKWFEYGGGKLTNDSINIPGSSKTFKNGDTCPDGKVGELQVFVTRVGNSTEERLQGNDLDRFIPHDGDRIRIVFGPPEEVQQTEDRTIIPEAQATRTIAVTVTDDGTEPGTKFDPATFDVSQGEVVKIVVKNTGKISHSFDVAGADGKYQTSDDFLVTPDGDKPDLTSGILQPGAQGSAIVRIDVTGEIPFRDSSTTATGTIVVRKSEATVTPTPAATGNAEPVDVEFNITAADNTFSQTQFTLNAGQKFRFKIKNSGPKFVHDMRIDGPDGQFDTDDDMVSDPKALKAGDDGTLVGKIDKPGTYNFRDDFHPTEMKGTIVVK